MVSMKKIISLVLLLLLVCAGLLVVPHLTAARPAQTATTTAKRPSKKPAVPKLTRNDLQHSKALTYSSIIYFAVKHSQLQRWQEVSDFKLGWQVEIYPRNGQTKYLVWPDQHIQDSAKNLAPNWFRFKDSQHVLYDSMIVHSFRKDQTKTASLTEIVKQINIDHAAAKVRAMPQRLSVVTHK